MLYVVLLCTSYNTHYLITNSTPNHRTSTEQPLLLPLHLFDSLPPLRRRLVRERPLYGARLRPFAPASLSGGPPFWAWPPPSGPIGQRTWPLGVAWNQGKYPPLPCHAQGPCPLADWPRGRRPRPKGGPTECEACAKGRSRAR